MQFKQFEIDGLFGGKSHHIDFPTAQEDRVDPLVLILHGRNGVGKTTILRMLDGLLRLDFNLFRHVPFDHCALRFDSNESITVKPVRDRRFVHIEVEFNGKKALLNPHKSGALNDEQILRVEEFRKEFFEKTESINYEFINTERLELQRLEDEHDPELRAGHQLLRRPRPSPNPKAKFLEQPQSLATRVKRFISQAQVNYRSFFATTEPELFPKIIERLTSPRLPVCDVNSLQERFEEVHSSDELNARFGLEPDRWDRGQIMAILNTF